MEGLLSTKVGQLQQLQVMELLMAESHMNVQDIKSIPHLLVRTAIEVCLPLG